ncbi:MAG TPA: hypothetical protein VGD01_16105 [Candidatus Elarobacter sp.]|jgi:hypothetical protein
MNPQEPVVPDPDRPGEQPGGPVSDPSLPERPREYQARDADYSEGMAEYEAIKREEGRDDDEGLDDYDQAVAESFPASDPPAASEPGAT